MEKKLNKLTKTHPEIAEEFHPTKNGELLVTELTKSSCEKVWWQCAFGHEFQRTVVQRTKNQECPICRKSQRPNHLINTYPNIINGCHPTKNEGDVG